MPSSLFVCKCIERTVRPKLTTFGPCNMCLLGIVSVKFCHFWSTNVSISDRCALLRTIWTEVCGRPFSRAAWENPHIVWFLTISSEAAAVSQSLSESLETGVFDLNNHGLWINDANNHPPSVSVYFCSHSVFGSKCQTKAGIPVNVLM